MQLLLTKILVGTSKLNYPKTIALTVSTLDALKLATVHTLSMMSQSTTLELCFAKFPRTLAADSSGQYFPLSSFLFVLFIDSI